MKRTTIALALCLSIVGAGRAVAADRSVDPYAALNQILGASRIVVLLPVPVPRALGPVRSIAAIVSGKFGYYIGFSPVPNCAGALSCAFFHVSGFARSQGRFDRATPHGREIRLAGGAIGRFTPEDCSGASCTEASLTFVRGGVRYEIDVKSGADDRAILIDAFNHLRARRSSASGNSRPEAR